MSSTMLAPSPAGQGRISQLLPTVKCSTCHQPVPLSELGEHTCSGPPPPPTLPKPSVPQDKVSNLLPQRLQGRVGSPGPSGPSSSNPGNPPRGPPQQHQRLNSAASERLRVNTNTSGPSVSGFRSSPLARSDSGQDEDTSPTNLTDPFRARPPATADPRMRNNSLSSNYSSPITARPAGSPNSNAPPPMDQNRFPPSRNGTPQIPSSAPAVGLPNNPRSPNAPQPGRPSFNGMPPPITRNASPAPSHLSINRNQPSPAPSLNRNTGPSQIRGPGPMGPPPPRPGGPPGPPPSGPPPNLPPGGPPGRNAVPFPGGAPPSNGMGPGPEGPPRPPFAGHAPQRSYTGSLPSTTLPGHIMAQPVLPYGQVVSEEDIDTRTGGEAGMAGVGRKGFAAVARAAMFATPAMRPLGPQPQGGRRPDAPRFLDIDAASKSTDTPPLSAGSGYSSHSPGPTSPQAQFPPEPPEKMPARAPTPPKIDTSVANPSIPAVDKDKTPVPAATTPASPFGIRLPFFEKLKNMVPGVSPVETTPTTPQPSNMEKEINHIERSTPTPTPAARSSPPPSETSSHTRSYSMKSSSSSRYDRPRDKVPISPTSGSDYSGLAYEASTDYGDDSRSQSSMRSDRSGARRELPPVPPLPPNVGSSSAAGGTRVNFASSSPIPVKSGGGGHSRNTSTSSYSSASSVDSQYVGGRKRTNSSAIAQALGLSQTPPTDYAKLGGPGMPSRQSRLERSASNSSLGSRSAYSRTASVVPGGASNAFDMLERSMLKREDEEKMVPKSELVKSKSMGTVGRQRTAGGTSISGSVRGTDYAGSEYERGSTSGSASGSRAHRSNTVQGVLSSPDGLKAPKLPVRAKTTTAENGANASGEGRTKERRRKEKVCVKCRKTIADGRWIQVDTGSILCERCWKNMYLPKCRRCNLPIEKQAVSSSDGQLKGKYHKECFNCHTCHKPFPDKTFYVFDGKPFCAYHYHEANESLCAAARCGQPIEGPCAVSHAGDRYHPDCMTCEYPGYPDCRERLKEYFEVDGRMLCERHAMSSENDDEDDWEKTTKATRRVTRFIDLNNNSGGGGDDDGLR